MRRKVIKQGNGTLTVTLPKEWTRKMNLTGQEEINISEQGKELILSPSESMGSKKIKVDISNMNNTTIRWNLYSIYTRGYEEIELFYKDPQIGALIEETLSKDYLGFEVIEHKERRCIIKHLSSDIDKEFENTLRRVFSMISYMADSIIKYIEKKNTENLDELLYIETNINRLTNFCERTLNKSGYKERYKTNVVYLITWQLEIIGDCFRDITNQLKSSKNPLSKGAEDYFKEAVMIFKDYESTFYNFNPKKLDKIVRNIKSSRDSFNKLLVIKKDLFVIIKSGYVIEKISEIVSQVYMVNLEY